MKKVDIDVDLTVFLDLNEVTLDDLKEYTEETLIEEVADSIKNGKWQFRLGSSIELDEEIEPSNY